MPIDNDLWVLRKDGLAHSWYEVDKISADRRDHAVASYNRYFSGTWSGVVVRKENLTAYESIVELQHLNIEVTDIGVLKVRDGVVEDRRNDVLYPFYPEQLNILGISNDDINYHLARDNIMGSVYYSLGIMQKVQDNVSITEEDYNLYYQAVCSYYFAVDEHREGWHGWNPHVSRVSKDLVARLSPESKRVYRKFVEKDGVRHGFVHLAASLNQRLPPIGTDDSNISLMVYFMPFAQDATAEFGVRLGVVGRGSPPTNPSEFIREFHDLVKESWNILLSMKNDSPVVNIIRCAYTKCWRDCVICANPIDVGSVLCPIHGGNLPNTIEIPATPEGEVYPLP